MMYFRLLVVRSSDRMRAEVSLVEGVGRGEEALMVPPLLVRRFLWRALVVAMVMAVVEFGGGAAREDRLWEGKSA